MPFIGSKIRKGFVAGAVVAACAMVAPSAASASCPPWFTVFSGEMSQKYAHLGDMNHYYLLSGGSFDPWSDNPFSAWILDGRAKRVQGGDTTRVGDPRWALRMRSGSKVQSAWFCIDYRHPYFRFSAKFLGGGDPSVSRLKVRVAAWGGFFGKHTYSPRERLYGVDYKDWKNSNLITLTDQIDMGNEKWRIARVNFEAADGDWKIDSINIDPYRR